MEKAKFEIVRIQTNYPDAPGLEEDLIKQIEHLCKAFEWGLKIIDSFMDGNHKIYVVDIFYLSESIYKVDYWAIIKTFIVHYDLRLVNIESTVLSDEEFSAVLKLNR